MKIRHSRRASAIAAVALLLAACGGSDDDGSLTNDAAVRTIEIEMVDIAFKPDRINVTKGEEVRFVFTNSGKVRHEGYIGTSDDQADHEMEMAEGEDAEHDAHGGNADERTATVEPGGKGELTYRFAGAGTLEVGCHAPGHYAAGMKIAVDVS